MVLRVSLRSYDLSLWLDERKNPATGKELSRQRAQQALQGLCDQMDLICNVECNALRRTDMVINYGFIVKQICPYKRVTYLRLNCLSLKGDRKTHCNELW